MVGGSNQRAEKWETPLCKRPADPKNTPDHTPDRSGPERTGPGSERAWPSSYLGQSSPSSGVISVSLCTTTLVTDMSGCCSLASFMA